MKKIIHLLIEETGLLESDLLRIVRNAPRRYKVFEIPKRSGGMREIAQPARELKMLQRVLVHHVLERLPIHDAARAYRSGMSIKDNALPHAGHGSILKMDFKDFFPSIVKNDWENYCRDHAVLDLLDREISSQIFFRRAKGESRLKLSVGAPSSPILSNILMFKFDKCVFEESAKRGVNYTRYADDLTFSGQSASLVKEMVHVVRSVLSVLAYPRLTVNEQKTILVTAKHRRVVTGVTLTNSGGLSLGRDRKRLISAQVHHALQGLLLPEAMGVLAGQLAFVNVVEPLFLDRLRERYGGEIIATIRKSVAPKI